VSTSCGAPTFKPSVVTNVEIEYVEFNSTQLNSSDPVLQYGDSGNLGSNDANKRASSPATGMPRRNQYFEKEVGGNSISSNYITDYDSATNGTIIGKSGRYDEIAGGKKAFGNPT
jgi:hypothetical protein